MASDHMPKHSLTLFQILSRIQARYLVGAGMLMFLSATAIMLGEAFSRAFLDSSYFWAEESVRFLMIWAFFLTIGAAGAEGHHIRTEMLVDHLGPRAQRAADMIACLVGLAFGALLFYASLPQLARYYTMGMMTDSNLDLPIWLVFLCMPMGAALLFFYYFGALLQVLKGQRPFDVDHIPLVPSKTKGDA